MFQFLFKYPSSTFTNGQFVLLGAWPRWILWLAMLAAAAGLAWLASRLPRLPSGSRNWRAGIVLWVLESAMAVVLLLLLWQPAVTITALKPQQNRPLGPGHAHDPGALIGEGPQQSAYIADHKQQFVAF